MSVRKIIVLVFVWALLALVSSARAVTMAELEEQLTIYFNEQLYGSCKAVVLTEQAGDVYEGYVLFMNGRRSDLRVTVSDRKIEYTFVKPVTPGSDSPSPQQMQARIRELEAVVGRQQQEIARLGRQSQPPVAEHRTETPARDRAAESDVPPDAMAEPRFTLEMYRRIEKGMSRPQVTEILEAPGTQLSSSYFDNAVNEIRVWTNEDDSHLCVVFRDGEVLVKTQFGLDRVSRRGAEQSLETDYFDRWRLARESEGQIVPLQLSFGQWLGRVYGRLGETSAEPRVDIIEEGDRVIVQLAYEDADGVARDTYLFLTCQPSTLPDPNAPDTTTVARVCLPAGVRIDGIQYDNPTRAWQLMAALADLPEE